MERVARDMTRLAVCYLRDRWKQQGPLRSSEHLIKQANLMSRTLLGGPMTSASSDALSACCGHELLL